MKKNYVSPQIEVIEIEIEGAILVESVQTTSLTSVKSGGTAF